MFIILAVLSVSSAFEPVQVHPEIMQEILACFDKRSSHWINGSHKLTLKEGEKVTYELSGPKPSDGKMSGISITFREGQHWTLLMLDAKTGTLDLGGTSDPKHREYQPNTKFAAENGWYGKEASRITNAVIALCRR